MGFISVKNKKGTGDNSPPSGYSSWLDYWETSKSKKAGTCEVLGCNNDARLGGHVFKAGKTSKEYIIPLCHNHNNKPDGEVFTVLESELVSVT
jgi:hypothetical protein